jgi:hypothetical protein
MRRRDHLGIPELNTIPKPCEGDASGLTETGWDVYELRIAFRATDQPLGFVAVAAFTAARRRW